MHALHAELGRDALQHACPEGCCLTCQTSQTDSLLQPPHVRFFFDCWRAVLVPDRNRRSYQKPLYEVCALVAQDVYADRAARAVLAASVVPAVPAVPLRGLLGNSDVPFAEVCHSVKG